MMLKGGNLRSVMEVILSANAWRMGSEILSGACSGATDAVDKPNRLEMLPKNELCCGAVLLSYSFADPSFCSLTANNSRAAFELSFSLSRE